MDEWMNVHMDVQMDGGKDEQTNGQMHTWMEG